jgi:hypothetical protein
VIEMIRRFLRQRLRSSGILVLLGLLAILTGITSARAGIRGGPAGDEYLALLILAAASVSKDASSGALQMILARPIRRTEYLFGRYFGILAAFAVYLTACSLVSILVRVVWMRDAPPLAPLAMLAGLGDAMLWAAQMAAVLVFFSTFLPGYGDVIAFVVLQGFLSIRTNVAWIQKTGETIRRELLPAVGWENVFRGEPDALADAGRATLAAVLFLTAAAVVFSRREFSYGRD